MCVLEVTLSSLEKTLGSDDYDLVPVGDGFLAGNLLPMGLERTKRCN